MVARRNMHVDKELIAFSYVADSYVEEKTSGEKKGGKRCLFGVMQK